MKRSLAAGADVHALDDEALRAAASRGHTKVVEVLLEADADVNAGRDPALRWASQHGYTEIVKMLLAAGANVHAENEYALREAAINERSEVIEVLLGAGADMKVALRAALKEKTRSVLKGLIYKIDEAEYASWANVPPRPDRCPQCGRGVARLPMVSPLKP